MEQFPWDSPLMGLQLALDTHIGHYIVAAATAVSLLAWILTRQGTGARRLAAVALGGSLAFGAIVVMGQLFAAGAIPPGGMP